MIWLEAAYVSGAAVGVLLTAHFALRSAVTIARRLGWSDALIGMTVVSIGTSLPELITHIAASIKIVRSPERLHELSGLVIGTNVGSDVFQQNFLLSLVALLGTVTVDRKRFGSDMGGLLGSAVLLLAVAWDGFIAHWEGALLVGSYLAYLYFLGSRHSVETPDQTGAGSLKRNVAVVCVSFGIMAWAAEILVDHSTTMAEALSVSTSFFGVLLLGVATAFPELVTSVLAIYRGEHRISAGVLIGSNVTNPTFVLGLGAAVSGYAAPEVVVVFDLPVKIATALALMWFLWDREMKKTESLILIAGYAAYLYLRLQWYPVDS